MRLLIRLWKKIAVNLRWAFVFSMLSALSLIYLKTIPERWVYGEEVGQFIEGLAMAYVTAFIFFLLTDARRELVLHDNTLTIYGGELHDLYIKLKRPFISLLYAWVRLCEGKEVDRALLWSMSAKEFTELFYNIIKHTDERQTRTAASELLVMDISQIDAAFDRDITLLLSNHHTMPDQVTKSLEDARAQASNLKYYKPDSERIMDWRLEPEAPGAYLLLRSLLSLRASLLSIIPYVMGPPRPHKLSPPDMQAYMDHISGVQKEIRSYRRKPV